MASPTRDRAELLTAATKRLLRSEGLRGPTTERVARGAYVAVGTIYNHFIDIDDLVAFAIADLLEEDPGFGQSLSEKIPTERPRVGDHLQRELRLRSIRR